jgi:serine-type D-Ala-D-Ala carboxypeptidase
VSSGTPFDLASVTKSLFAAAFARACRQGRVRWDTPLGTALPEIAGTASASVPLEQLLAHRAGLEPHRPLYAPLCAGAPFARTVALREAANARRPDAAGDLPADGFPPLYSDLGYLLAGEAVSRTLGIELDEFMLSEVAGTLGVELGSARQWWGKDGKFSGHVAATEVVAWRGGTLRGVVHDENAWALVGHGTAGHAGLFGTVEALLRFGTSVLDALAGRDDGFLDRESVLRLTRPRPGGTLRAGFDGVSGPGSAAGSRLGTRSFGHLGFTGTSIWCDPERDLVTVLLTNRVHPSRDRLAIRKARPAVQDALVAWAAQNHELPGPKRNSDWKA